jgi:hypothetical protein
LVGWWLVVSWFEECGARREKVIAARAVVDLLSTRTGRGLPCAGGEAVAGRLCGAERSAQTREYAPLPATGGGGREAVEGGRCSGRLRGGCGVRAHGCGRIYLLILLRLDLTATGPCAT